MIENSLILSNRPDDQPIHLSRAQKTLSIPDLVIASDHNYSEDMWQEGEVPAGRQRPPACSTESDTHRTDHLLEEGIQLELQKGRLVQVPKPDWRTVQRTWHWLQQEHQHQCPAADWLHTPDSKAGHPQRQKKRPQALLEQPPSLPPWPTHRNEKTTWAAPFARAHHLLQQGKN